MAKADPRETTGRTGPARTSSGTRVAAVRLTPLEPGVSSQRGANDFNQMPTRELDQEQLRAMALRCASDFGPGDGAHRPAAMPVADTRSRPRLQLMLAEDEAPRAAVDADLLDGELGPSRRSRGLALVVVVVMFAVAAVAAYETYGVMH